VMVSAFFKSLCLRSLPVVLVLATVASAQSKAPAGPLPQTFSGWRIDSKSVKASNDPAAADATDAPVLKEYGFADVESATYSRNGRTMQIKAARFSDATGAFGAFTYYFQPQMQVEKIGDRAASSNTRILFFRGNILVDATIKHLSAMSGAACAGAARPAMMQAPAARMVSVRFNVPSLKVHVKKRGRSGPLR